MCKLQKGFYTLYFCTWLSLQSFGASGPNRMSEVSIVSFVPFVTLSLINRRTEAEPMESFSKSRNGREF